ncbi:hypothetical protein ABW19_dt0202844 [Dactylella cylindrospora]|nr:hypothetical protein ABW19_dt0202844 [Dactylella cylindrospora]
MAVFKFPDCFSSTTSWDYVNLEICILTAFGAALIAIALSINLPSYIHNLSNRSHTHNDNNTNPNPTHPSRSRRYISPMAHFQNLNAFLTVVRENSTGPEQQESMSRLIATAAHYPWFIEDFMEGIATRVPPVIKRGNRGERRAEFWLDGSGREGLVRL